MKNLMQPYIEGLGIIRGSSNKKKKQNLEKNIFDDIISKSIDKKEAVKKNRDVKNKDKDLETVSSLNIALSHNAVNNNVENLKNVKSEENKIKTGLEVNSSTINKNSYKNQLTITKFIESIVNVENSRKFKNDKALDKSSLEISNTLTVNENLNKQINQIKDFKLAMGSLEIRQQKIESIIKSNQFQDKISLQMKNTKQGIKRENLNVIEEENLPNLKSPLKKLNKMNNLAIDKTNIPLDDKNKSNSDVNNKLQKDVIYNLLKKKEEFDKLTSKIEDKKTGELKEFNILKSNKEPELEISINNFNENLRAEGLQNSNEVNFYTNKNNDGNNLVATNYNDNLPQSVNINISNSNDSNSNYQNNQNDNNFNKNMNGQNQNNNSFVFSYNQTNISANLASNALNLVINTKDVILDDITILQIQQILKDNGFKHHNITIKDKEKVLKLYEYKAINNSNTSGINLAV
ncbi:MAG TPA: hypothetical protein DEA57_03750 [Sulfurihydrogenibium sp.]|uniref:hypothetical protein n=1 Tax=Sulfurihydrogenibium sp. (strain YO3AOP1) TaxID=436114 RepID=UPI0001726735|nr:hypothetical protein [Sulfurihydrogenibium sp. YO3AOP1]ACD67245.1 hypothetical protein SYO3AOP1_1647 [Sulfurihydrogenibium sp. YO3AOP1]HBT98578.1 hypothetical protein [Sulfurihydrogenibium sp.]